MSLALCWFLPLAMLAAPRSDTPRPQAGEVFDLKGLKKEDLGKLRFFAADPAQAIMPAGAEALDLTDPSFQAKPLRLRNMILGGGATQCYLVRIPAGAQLQAEIDNPHLRVKAFRAEIRQRRGDPGARHPLQLAFRATYENRGPGPVDVICQVHSREVHGQEDYTLTVSQVR
ncbi:MAG: hypothetical protein U0P81_05935 [Holophagaceae bacterium]